MIKVLIVEDDAEEMRLYEGAFQLNGYGVDKAHNGEEALQKLKLAEEKPAVIVLDLMMPNMNGFDVLKQLKANPELKNIPVAVLTNLAQSKDVEEVFKLGAAIHLVKSKFDPQQIVEKVGEVIKINPAAKK